MAYKPSFKNDDTELLFEVILQLDSKEDCYRFFEDVCTFNEIHAIAQRIAIAKLLSESHTYQEIEAKTKASTATISRINRFLKHGAGGYKSALSKLANPEKKSK